MLSRSRKHLNSRYIGRVFLFPQLDTVDLGGPIFSTQVSQRDVSWTTLLSAHIFQQNTRHYVLPHTFIFPVKTELCERWSIWPRLKLPENIVTGCKIKRVRMWLKFNPECFQLFCVFFAVCSLALYMRTVGSTLKSYVSYAMEKLHIGDMKQ